jgi:hypothetical protein
MTVNARRRLEADLKDYLVGNKPREVDVFHYLSLTFSQPSVFLQDDPNKPENLREARHEADRQGQPPAFILNEKTSVKVTGSSNSGNGIVLQFEEFSFDQNPADKRRALCYSGVKGDHKVCVELTAPLLGWGYGPFAGVNFTNKETHRTLTLEFALDDERLISPQGASGTFVLSAFAVDDRDPPDSPGPPVPVVIKFPVVLRKLNLGDAFFNGLPTEWKENLKSLIDS